LYGRARPVSILLYRYAIKTSSINLNKPSLIVKRPVVKKCGTEAYPTIVASVLLRDVPIIDIGATIEFFSIALHNALFKSLITIQRIANLK
jgi:hypothetical protein